MQVGRFYYFSRLHQNLSRFLPINSSFYFYNEKRFTDERGESMRLLYVRAVLGMIILLAACKGVSTPTPEAVPTIESQIALPSQFEDKAVTTVNQPTGLAFTPDGRLFITEKPGRLIVFKNGLQSAALDISSKVCSGGERGLLGVAVDFEFSQNNYIYLYYTYNKPGSSCATNSSNVAVNRVSRFVLSSTNQITPNSEVVLLDNIPSYAGNHNGGDVHFGKDGYLYVSVGDGGCDYAGNSGCAGDNDAAKDKNTLLGKILRITREGDIPPGNPFTGANTARCNTGNAASGKTCQEAFATGLRNPFRIAFNPNSPSTQFYINDVGQNVWEEIDVGKAGADYGWNTREGKCANGSSTNCAAPPSGLTNPIYTYSHGNGCNSITGGAFVPNGYWPVGYDNTYLFSDYVCGKLFLLKGSGTTYTATEFATGLGNSSAVHLTFGPDGTGQSLYYTTFAGGGQVRKIRYVGTGNRTPTASFKVTPNSGALPLVVSFDASASSDPDGDALTYSWNFGSGTTGSGKTVQKTYTTAGKVNVVLTVRDSKGATSTKTLPVFPGNTAPTTTITSPSSRARFVVGQSLTLQGSGADAQDGNLPASSLRWTVRIRHNNHTHPYATSTGSSLTVTMPAPEDLAATETSWLEATLVATDSQGLSRSVFQKLLPTLVTASFATNPAGRTLTVNGVTFTTPKTLKSWPNYSLRVNAPNQGNATFQSWSDGGAQAHTLKTPTGNSSYTATFRVQ
jgi:glucose/arabinose dehydrogenase